MGACLLHRNVNGEGVASVTHNGTDPGPDAMLGGQGASDALERP